MAKNTPILNALCYQLPGYLTRPMYLEYESRKTQIDKIWNAGYREFQPLLEYEHVVDILLSVCIYYRYILGSMNGASDFFYYLNKQKSRKKDCEIRCGDFRLSREQYNKMLSVAIAFNKIREKYQLSDAFFDFSDTFEFLRNCNSLLNMPENNTDNKESPHEEDYPF